MSHFSEKVHQFYENFWTVVQPFDSEIVKIGKEVYDENVQTTLTNILSYISSNFRYETDMNLWGQEDYWASATEVAREKAGDCDDLVMFASSVLLSLGIPHYVVLGHLQGQIEGLEVTPEVAAGHVWIEVDSDKFTYLAEPTTSALYIIKHGDYSRVPYHPVESVLIE